LQKEEFRSFDVAAVVRELKGIILNSRVGNIYQLDKSTLLLKLRKDENVYGLILEAGKRLNLTSYTLEKPLTPPAFCMALRKYIRNSTLTNIEQYRFERIVILSFTGKAGNFRLVAEFFGDGNIILVDDEGKIVQALRYKRMRDRNILRGEAFSFPPPSGQNPLELSFQAFHEGLKAYGKMEVVRALARFLGIGGIYAEEILLRVGINKATPCSDLNVLEMEEIYNCLKGLVSQVLEGKLEPCVVLDERGGLLDVTPVRLKRYEGFKHQFYNSFNEALDEFYIRIKTLERVKTEEVEESLRREIERLKRVLADQEKALREAERKAENYKRIGDLICIYSGELQALLNKIWEKKKFGEDWKTITSEILAEKSAGLRPSTFFESIDGQRLVLNICIEDVAFSLNMRRDLFANAAEYYEKAKVAKRKVEGAIAAIEETKRKLQEVEAKLREISEKAAAATLTVEEELSRRRVRQKHWFEKFRWFVTSDGFLVVAGKDAATNEKLIKKYTAPEDLVFHADITGAPFVIVKTEGKTPSEQCIREAAEFAAAYSRGWQEGFASLDVYWVRPNQLKKAGPSGEYVPRGAFVIHGSRNWLRNIPLRVAVGVLLNQETKELTIIGGAVEAVKAKTNIYAILVPGRDRGKPLLLKVLAALAEKAPKSERERLSKVNPEVLRGLIPYTCGSILQE
jgi:predicted ribosome quality control (RQC) complex YloA/Tae2 family protein